jgi:hypothetical protein
MAVSCEETSRYRRVTELLADAIRDEEEQELRGDPVQEGTKASPLI